MKNLKKIEFLACLIIMNMFFIVFLLSPVGAQAATFEATFGLEIEGVPTGYFTECTDIGSQSEVVEHRVVDGSGIDSVQKIPGRLTWNNIVLKRGITNDQSMWEWRKQVEDGDIVHARKNITIVKYNDLNEEVARWNFNNAWPCGISISTDSSGSITEEIELAYEKVERTSETVVSKTYSIASLDDLIMNPLTAGYGLNTQEEKIVTITETGTGTLSNLAVTSSGDEAGDFEISQPTVTTLNTDLSFTTFTVKAIDSLPSGTYTATVTISADDMNDVHFTVTQVVNPAPIVNATISPYEVVFDLDARADITTSVAWNSAQSVSDIVYGSLPMLSGTDYIISGDVLTINQDFISSLDLTEGDTIDFEIFFDVGDSAVLTVDIVNGYIPGTDAALKELKVGSSLIEDFDADKFSYNIDLPYDTQAGNAISLVSAEPRDAKASVVISQAPNLPGTTTIEVTADDNLTKLTYVVNLTLAAPTYTVTFNKNGGDTEASPTTKIVSSGGNVGTLPEPPTRSGYSFDCWNTTAAGNGTVFTADTVVSSNTTVFAQWTPDNHHHHSDNVSEQIIIRTLTSEDQKTITASTTITAEIVGSNGMFTAHVEKYVMNDLFDKALESEIVGQNSVIEIKIAAPANAMMVEVEIPRAAFDELADTTMADVKVDTGLGIITFNAEAVDTISSASATGKIYIRIARVDTFTLPQELQGKIGDRPVYDFSVRAGRTGIYNFSGGCTEISIPYTPKDREDINAIVIYYISINGELIPIRGRYNPSSVTVNFTTNHFSQFVVGYNQVSFNDVADTDWYSDAVDFLASRDIITGKGNGGFDPEEKLTRGQSIVMVMKAYCFAPDENPADNFADAGNTYYTNYLATAKRLGITSGVGNNLFAPNQEITRQEMITLLYHSIKLMGELPTETNGKTLTDFDDAVQVAPWAKDAITLFVKTGIISGDDSKLSPGEMTKRLHLAQMLHNILTK